MTSRVDDFWRSRIRFREGISPESTLTEVLTEFTKDNLQEIGGNLRLSGLSKLKKAELVRVVRDNLGAKLYRIYELFDDERYQLVQQIIKEGNLLLAAKVSGQKINYLLQRGVAFPIIHNGQEMLYMPQEVSDAFLALCSKDYSSLVKKNNELVLLAHGMLHYYGVLAKADFRRLLQTYVPAGEISVRDYLVIYESMTYYQRVLADFDYFMNMEVNDEDWVVQQQRARLGLDYYPFTKQQLIEAGHEGYAQRSPGLSQVTGFVQQYSDLSAVDLDHLMRQFVLLCQADADPGELVTTLTSRISLPSVDYAQKMLSLVTQVANNTRKWNLKGHTPTELSQAKRKHLSIGPSNEQAKSYESSSNLINIRTKQRVGRNDPCPCGSGKKFKRCCGR